MELAPPHPRCPRPDPAAPEGPPPSAAASAATRLRRRQPAAPAQWRPGSQLSPRATQSARAQGCLLREPSRLRARSRRGQLQRQPRRSLRGRLRRCEPGTSHSRVSQGLRLRSPPCCEAESPAVEAARACRPLAQQRCRAPTGARRRHVAGTHCPTASWTQAPPQRGFAGLAAARWLLKRGWLQAPTLQLPSPRAPPLGTARRRSAGGVQPHVPQEARAGRQPAVTLVWQLVWRRLGRQAGRRGAS